tara:strand:+ start:142 stop:444 length:303 start_codon:yes stop_codon:yes gene_type:complete
MKQIILDTLEDVSQGQINLASQAARETIASLLTAALKTKGEYTEYVDAELEENEARESWVCQICEKNTYDVDWDYIGSGTNHLGCELEIELAQEAKNESK